MRIWELIIKYKHMQLNLALSRDKDKACLNPDQIMC